MKNLSKLIIMSTMVSSCASIVSTSQWPVKIDSSVPGATVSIRNEAGIEVQKVITPASVVLSSGGGWNAENYKLSFEKQGYESTTESLNSQINGWYWGNFGFGGILGMFVVDPASGAMWKLKDSVFASLRKIDDIPAQPLLKQTAPSNQEPPKQEELGGVVEQLQQLKKLKDQGLLTSKEYESKRRVLVDRL